MQIKPLVHSWYQVHLFHPNSAMKCNRFPNISNHQTVVHRVVIKSWLHFSGLSYLDAGATFFLYFFDIFSTQLRSISRNLNKSYFFKIDPPTNMGIDLINNANINNFVKNYVVLKKLEFHSSFDTGSFCLSSFNMLFFLYWMYIRMVTRGY